MNTLVIETAFLGDAIVSLSLARELKRLDPQGCITYLVHAGVDEIIAASPDVESAIPFDKRGTEQGMNGILKKAEELNSHHFDTLFLLHSSRRSQELARRLKCKRKVGFEFMVHADLTDKVTDAGWSNRYERALLPLRVLFPEINSSALPRIVPKPFPLVNSFFERWKKTIVLAPGSVWETKKWGDDRFCKLAQELTQQGIGIIIAGSDAEHELGMKIRSMCPTGSVFVLAGYASMLEAMSAMARASLVVANDSAPVHAAVAVGTKVLAIYGPTVPAFGFAPPASSGDVMELRGLWCRPCTPHGSHECPIYTHECMRGISVASVIKKIEAMLQETTVG